MKLNAKKLEFCQNFSDDILLADGFEAAFLGVVVGKGKEEVACYDYSKCIKILEKDMPHDDAVGFFEYNVIDAYVGPRTPMFLFKP